MASRTVRARLDPAAERGLAALMGEGRNESEAVRAALAEAGRTRLRRAAVAEEAALVGADPADLAEQRAVSADLESLSPDWPE